MRCRLLQQPCLEARGRCLEALLAQYACGVVCRLDKDTSGLLLLTTYSELVHTLTSPKHQVEKLYRVTLANAVAESARAEWVRPSHLAGCLRGTCDIVVMHMP